MEKQIESIKKAGIELERIEIERDIRNRIIHENKNVSLEQFCSIKPILKNISLVWDYTDNHLLIIEQNGID